MFIRGPAFLKITYLWAFHRIYGKYFRKQKNPEFNKIFDQLPNTVKCRIFQNPGWPQVFSPEFGNNFVDPGKLGDDPGISIY